MRFIGVEVEQQTSAPPPKKILDPPLTRRLFQIRACVISARKTKQLDATTVFAYSHANTPLGQSERAYHLSYFINSSLSLLARQSMLMLTELPEMVTYSV